MKEKREAAEGGEGGGGGESMLQQKMVERYSVRSVQV